MYTYVSVYVYMRIHPNLYMLVYVHICAYTKHPTPYPHHPTPYTLKAASLHPTSHALHPTPYTLHPTPLLNKSYTWNPKS